MGEVLPYLQARLAVSSVSTVDCAVMICVLAPKQMGSPATMKKYPDVDLTVIGIAFKDSFMAKRYLSAFLSCCAISLFLAVMQVTST